MGAHHDFPVMVLFWGNLDAGAALIDRHPDTRFIIDRLGILREVGQGCGGAGGTRG